MRGVKVDVMSAVPFHVKWIFLSPHYDLVGCGAESSPRAVSYSTLHPTASGYLSRYRLTYLISTLINDWIVSGNSKGQFSLHALLLLRTVHKRPITSSGRYDSTTARVQHYLGPHQGRVALPKELRRPGQGPMLDALAEKYHTELEWVQRAQVREPVLPRLL